ncbi:type II secretion system F family protein [Hyphobacterium marinum]|uniref:Type II secretion system F family protein n=1 Tax=Hyphobacterium marinum TaxID=3116574 RepID=A0ABU7LW69_9PROT|nr:type II secretion system F family protein [Hyphobacterium sp. Y6023]MEE2565796.1 type II secretion system F family protein [Hyphobacterium sp. Y6023]
MDGNISLIAAALAAFIAVAGVGWVAAGAMGDGRKANRRKAIAVGDPLARGKRQASALDQSAQRRRQVQESLKDIEERQRNARKKAVTLKSRIEQAGFSFKPTAFWIGSGVLAVVAFAVAMITGQSLLVSAGITIAAGLGVPRWFLGMKVSGRQKKFTAEFANALDIIVRGVKSGLPLNECLKVIARETPDPVGSEFAKLVEAQSVGVSLEDGIKKMCERMPLPELNFFATVLTIQQKTGGNLAEALANLSAVLRARKMMREKISALSSEAKASAMIIGALPPGVLAIVYFTTPSYMTAMFVEPKGQLMLLGGAMWMGIGILMMRGMINFKH